MSRALEQARAALAAGEAPIGAVLLDAGGVEMAAAFNTMRASRNPVLHAEINAFSAAAGRFEGAGPLALVTTLEPCVMCLGAAMQVGVTTIVYALVAPADDGTTRVSPPTSPGTTNPTVVGGHRAAESRAMFVEWLQLHEGDATRADQRKFITQLLALTADAT